MKLDTIRAWKDETYRQSLNNEQINTLPANPAGELELSSTDLESINGGGGFVPGLGNGFGLGAASSSSSAFSTEESRFHSLAFKCNETVFSITSVHGFNVLSPVNAFCINDED